MACYLEVYRARVGTWAARTSWATRTTWCTSQVNGRVTSCLGTVILCATTLAVLLVIGGVKKNLGSGVEAEKILQVCVAGVTEISNRELNVTRVDAGYHNSCGNVKAQMAESWKWTCSKCRSERLRLLE
jgi:hypothetical protein